MQSRNGMQTGYERMGTPAPAGNAAQMANPLLQQMQQGITMPLMPKQPMPVATTSPVQPQGRGGFGMPGTIPQATTSPVQDLSAAVPRSGNGSGYQMNPFNSTPRGWR